MVRRGGVGAFDARSPTLTLVSRVSETAGVIRRCPQCGGAWIPNLNGTAKFCSIDCAIKAMVEHNRQLRERRGERYARWVLGMRRMVDDLEDPN